MGKRGGASGTCHQNSIMCYDKEHSRTISVLSGNIFSILEYTLDLDRNKEQGNNPKTYLNKWDRGVGQVIENIRSGPKKEMRVGTPKPQKQQKNAFQLLQTFFGFRGFKEPIEEIGVGSVIDIDVSSIGPDREREIAFLTAGDGMYSIVRSEYCGNGTLERVTRRRKADNSRVRQRTEEPPLYLETSLWCIWIYTGMCEFGALFGDFIFGKVNWFL